MINKQDFKIEEFPDRALCLSCGGEDLIFAEGAMRGDPALDKQREILDYIMECIDVAFHGEYSR